MADDDTLNQGIDTANSQVSAPSAPSDASQAAGLAQSAVQSGAIKGAIGSLTGAGFGAGVATGAGAVAAPVVAYGTATGIGNIAQGKNLTGVQQASLALPTFGASFAYNPIADAFSSGKGEAQQARDGIRSDFQDIGLADSNYNVKLADGSTFNIGTDGNGGTHSVTNPSQLASNQQGISSLHSYDTDYTNNLDYTSSMGGIALSRLIGGNTSTATDQMGSQLGNAALGNIGYGQQMTQQNFNSMTANLRSIYSQAGIKSQSDAFQLANQAYAEGRINETDLTTMQQAFNIMYSPNGYQLANTLMSGRNAGIQTAAANASTPPQNAPAPTVIPLNATSKQSIIAQNAQKYGNSVAGNVGATA